MTAGGEPSPIVDAMRSAPNRASWVVTGMLLLAVVGACLMADVVTSPAELAGWFSWLGDDIAVLHG